MRAVHQFVPALIPRDATGSHTLLLREALRAAGWRSEIFAEATHRELAGESVRAEEYRGDPDDVLVYQLSTSSALAGFLADQPQRLVLDYHNITRPELSAPWDPEPARRSAAALRQLDDLAPRAVLGLADSAFNEFDLRAAGCRTTTVVPVLVDLDRLAVSPEPAVAARLAKARAAGGADWLFVGRVVPFKAQHALVQALWAYRRLYDPDARLHLVGATSSRRYVAAVRELVDVLGLATAVHLAGEVSDGALAAYYQAADVFVSASVHEGFGVPLLEAMHAGVPVVARAAAAVPETVGGAGIVLEPATPARMAAAVQRVLGDSVLRSRLVAAGRERAGARSLRRAGETTVAAIAAVVGEAGCG